MDFAETREAEKLLRRRDVEIERLRAWIDDLQSGMFINCVYCGHRYGPADEVPDSMADVLRRHVEQCPQHPMSRLRAALVRVHAIGYNEDCIFCGFKDRVATEALVAPVNEGG